eukprot:gene2470-4794_t
MTGLCILILLLSSTVDYSTALRVNLFNNNGQNLTNIEPAIADSKMRNLSPITIANIVTDDILKRQALATADFTRDIYDESCTFQDEINTYEIDEYVKGTKALFNGPRSIVTLTAPAVSDTDLVEIKFSETLAFNIPFYPKMDITGKVQYTLGKDGLITKSREIWDKSVVDVIRTTHF